MGQAAIINLMSMSPGKVALLILSGFTIRRLHASDQTSSKCTFEKSGRPLLVFLH